MARVFDWVDSGDLQLSKTTKGLFRRNIADIDIAFPIVHGNNAEDGTLQGYLDSVGIPYVGSKVLGSALGQDKVIMKQVFETDFRKLPSYHAIILAKNYVGLKNLYKIVSNGYLNCYSRNPRIPKTFLSFINPDLIICTFPSAAACVYNFKLVARYFHGFAGKFIFVIVFPSVKYFI